MKVMVSVSTKREGSPWSGERTLTLDLPEEDIREAWLREFPGVLDRALGKPVTPGRAVLELTPEDDDDDGD